VSHVADRCDFPNSQGRWMIHLPHHYHILWESTLFSWRVFCVISLIPLNFILLLMKLSKDSVTIVALLISCMWFCCPRWHVLPMMQLTFCFLSSGKYNHKKVFVCLEKTSPALIGSAQFITEYSMGPVQVVLHLWLCEDWRNLMEVLG